MYLFIIFCKNLLTCFSLSFCSAVLTWWTEALCSSRSTTTSTALCPETQKYTHNKPNSISNDPNNFYDSLFVKSHVIALMENIRLCSTCLLSHWFLLFFNCRHCLSSGLSSCVLCATMSTTSLWTCPCRLAREGSWDFKVRGSSNSPLDQVSSLMVAFYHASKNKIVILQM